MNDLNARGLICGPDERPEDFQKRCEFFSNLKEKYALIKDVSSFQQIKQYPTLQYEDLDLVIDWLLVNFSRKGLPLWEAAATWTLEIDKISVPILQIKGISKTMIEDILKHEVIHASRVTFKEPIYEEFLAYATSKSKWRSFFGPLFRSSKESMLFVLVSFLPLLNVFFSISILILFSPMIIFSLGLLGRLFFYYWKFKKALLVIGKVFDIRSPLKVALRLTDKEIHLFASSNLEIIQSYIDEQTSIRWKQILSSYFKK